MFSRPSQSPRADLTTLRRTGTTCSTATLQARLQSIVDRRSDPQIELQASCAKTA